MKRNKNTGFSLIGVIISIFITSTSLVGILGLANASLRSSAVGESRLTASGLAQEGIEIVRDIRRSESNWIDWEWYDDTYPTTTPSFFKNYRVQYNDTSFLAFSESLLKIDNDGFYQYDAGDDTIFYRKITLTKVSYQEVKVVVEIKWEIRNNSYYLTVEDHLWNWK